MAQAVLVDSGGREVRRQGMPAPRRPGELYKWFKAAWKALKVGAADPVFIEYETIHVGPDKLVFGLPDGQWIVIDRTANALGR